MSIDKSEVIIRLRGLGYSVFTRKDEFIVGLGNFPYGKYSLSLLNSDKFSDDTVISFIIKDINSSIKRINNLGV